MKNSTISRTTSALLFGASLLAATTAWSAPKTMELHAKFFYLNPITGETLATLPDPAPTGFVPMWGFATTADGAASVPGPQIDVDLTQNDGLAITVHNTLPEPISLVIPGLSGSAEVGQPARFAAGDANYPNRVRSFVKEVAVGDSYTYTWANLKPGTFVYHSGTHPALQVQMGLFGMVTIKAAAGLAYPGVPIGAGGEVPVILSEIDPVLHEAVAAGKYGPLPLSNPDGTPTGNISSTIHSEPSLFLINGRAYDPIGVIGATPPLEPAMKNGWTTLFRVINVGWDSHIPSLTGPLPSGSANYLKVIAEDGEPYPYPKTLYAPNLSALKTMDIQYTPPVPPAGDVAQEYQVYDRKLGLANGGGMFRKLNAEPAGSAGSCTPAAISTGPTSQSVAPGVTVNFSVTATGTPDLIYQWRKDYVSIPGATSSTLALTAVTTAASGSYDVVVANGCGSAISPAATLTVIPCFPAAIASTGQPASQTVDHGANATFTVTATGTTPLNYQWRKNTAIIPGATSSTLTLTAVTSAANAGSYDVVVTGPCGPSVTSAAATLAVRPVFVRSQTATRSNGTGVNSLTTPSITINGTSKLLVVAVVYRDTAGTPTPSIGSVVTVPTGAGAVAQSFTRLANGNWGNTQGKLDLWYLVAPNNTIGTSPVRVNFAGTTTMEQIAIVVDLFNGVNQTTPFGAATTDYSTANRNGTLNLNPASTTSDLVINWAGYNSVLNGVTDGAGQTSRGIATNPLLIATLQSASVRVTSKNGASPNTVMSEAFTTPSTVSLGAVAIKP